MNPEGLEGRPWKRQKIRVVWGVLGDQRGLRRNGKVNRRDNSLLEMKFDRANLRGEIDKKYHRIDSHWTNMRVSRDQLL